MDFEYGLIVTLQEVNLQEDNDLNLLLLIHVRHDLVDWNLSDSNTKMRTL